MNAGDVASELIKLTESWDVAGALLGFQGTEILNVVLTSLGEEPNQRNKSFNEISAEISSLMHHDYVPLGVIAWREYAPRQAKFMSQLYPERSQDSWGTDVFVRSIVGIMDGLRAKGSIVDIEQ